MLDNFFLENEAKILLSKYIFIVIFRSYSNQIAVILIVFRVVCKKLLRNALI